MFVQVVIPRVMRTEWVLYVLTAPRCVDAQMILITLRLVFCQGYTAATQADTCVACPSEAQSIALSVVNIFLVLLVRRGISVVRDC